MADKERNENAKREQRLLLDNRAALSLTGVADVISFDDSGALIKTDDGVLAVDGEGLHLTTLDIENGGIAFEGRINGLLFSDGAKGKGKRFR